MNLLVPIHTKTLAKGPRPLRRPEGRLGRKQRRRRSVPSPPAPASRCRRSTSPEVRASARTAAAGPLRHPLVLPLGPPMFPRRTPAAAPRSAVVLPSVLSSMAGSGLPRACSAIIGEARSSHRPLRRAGGGWWCGGGDGSGRQIRFPYGWIRRPRSCVVAQLPACCLWLGPVRVLRCAGTACCCHRGWRPLWLCVAGLLSFAGTFLGGI